MTDKPPMPAVVVKMADAALSRLRKTAFLPDLRQSEDGWACPYADEDEGRWWALMFDIFGTRMTAPVSMFLSQLAALVDSKWREDWEKWVADGEQMVAVLTLVQSIRPKDAAQAALAVQLVGLHLNIMRLSEGGLRYSSGDPRSVAVLAKATRAYADGLNAMQRLQGRGGKTSQRIKVEKRVYYQQQVNNFTGGGGTKSEAQPHAKPVAGVIEASATVPGASEDNGERLPIASGEGQAGLSNARRETQWRSSRGS